MNPDLYEAVNEGNSASLSHLFDDENLRREQTDQNKNTLLHIAASYNNFHVVEVIRNNQPTTILRRTNYKDDTALHIAARHNNVVVVKYLLRWAKETEEADKWPKVCPLARLKNRDGNTALHEAVLRRHREVIEVFMESYKEVIFIKNKRKESPLYLAADCGLHDSLEKMMIVALEDEASKKMKKLPVYEGLDGKTLLHVAVVKKHILCVNILLGKKKELISREDDEGRNPLHYAASFGHSEEARSILEKDPRIAHKKDKQGMYPIHIAANKGHVGIIQTMLEYCPETIETLYKEDQNVVHLAAKSGRENLVSYMLQQKSKFGKLKNEKDINGNTPLHLATKNSHQKVVRILMLGSVDKTVMNNEGLTALDIAEKEKRMEISLPKVLTLTTLKINGAPSGLPSIIEEDTSTFTPTVSTRSSSMKKDNKSKDDPETENYKDKLKERSSTLAVVATLIMTVTFAAGFTVPGGYNSDGPYKGMATLLKKPAFIVFVICNTLALYLSIVVVVNNIWAQWGDNSLLILAVNLSAPLLGIALVLMAIAFAAGLCSVILKLQWLSYLVLAIGAIFVFYIVVLLVLFNILKMSKHPVLREIIKWAFNRLIGALDRFLDDRAVH